MSDQTCSLLECGVDEDRRYELEDYQGAQARWCPGCGDHAILTSMQRLLESEQLAPERTVFVSGIGCSSRFPHYMKTYGFHGIHGRALPIATGVRLRRPDLNIFVVMGDGDCCSIGAGHWIHAIRYNTNMTALLLDNNIYGLTKNQTSPTTPEGYASNTQPEGTFLPALDPISATLGVTNASFVAQTADWVPGHLYATLKAAHRHKGFSFVRVLQRCPIWTPDIFQQAAQSLELTELLVHPDGIQEPDIEALYPNHVPHDPKDIVAARSVASAKDKIRLGLFFLDRAAPCYDETRQVQHRTAEEKIEALNAEFDRYAV